MPRHVRIVGALTLVMVSALEARAQMGMARGEVVDESGAPVAAATVSFEFLGGIDREYTAQTDDEGKYNQVVAAGRYRVTVSKEGYQGGYMDQMVNAGAPTYLPKLEMVSRESLVQEAMGPILEKFERAGALSREGKLDEALAIFEELASEQPQIPELHLNMGTLYIQQERWDEAERALLKTLELQPENARAAMSLSDVYASQGRDEEALATMQKLASDHPEDAAVQYGLGILYVNQRRTEEAYSTLDAVRQLDPDRVDVYYVLGTLALNMGRVEEAVAHLERYLEMAPEDAPYRSTASELVTQLGQAEQSQPQ